MIEFDFEDYKVGDMSVRSAMIKGQTEYDKVLLYMHGGGGNGPSTAMLLEFGMFGVDREALSGIKFVFPTSTMG